MFTKVEHELFKCIIKNEVINMCYGQFYGHQGRRGPFWQQRGQNRPFGPGMPFWFNRGNRWWNSEFRESIQFNEEKDQFEISIEVPGIPKEKIKVKANEQFLYVQIDNRESDEDKIYERRFPFRLEADLASIKAKYNNGLLTIEVPLKQSEKQDIPVE